MIPQNQMKFIHRFRNVSFLSTGLSLMSNLGSLLSAFVIKVEVGVNIRVDYSGHSHQDFRATQMKGPVASACMPGSVMWRPFEYFSPLHVMYKTSRVLYMMR